MNGVAVGQSGFAAIARNTVPEAGPEFVVEAIETFEQFAAHKHPWTQLLDRDPNSGLFMSWDWFAGPFLQNPGRLARAGCAAQGNCP